LICEADKNKFCLHTSNSRWDFTVCRPLKKGPI